MKTLLKRVLPKQLIDIYKLRQKSDRFKNRPIQETFTYIKDNKYWNSKESLSGDGSEISVTIPLRTKLSNLIKDYRMESMLDIPCGDFNWMQKMDLSGIDYQGADIVESLIQENIKQFESKNIKFNVLDLTKDDLPQVDLILCRDCLVHFSYKDIYKALCVIKKSKSKYLLLTSFLNTSSNRDIITGSWRKLNFQLKPFNFGIPAYVLNEEYLKKGDLYSDKALCLWEINNIRISWSLRLYFWMS